MFHIILPSYYFSCLKQAASLREIFQCKCKIKTFFSRRILQWTFCKVALLLKIPFCTFCCRLFKPTISITASLLSTTFVSFILYHCAISKPNLSIKLSFLFSYRRSLNSTTHYELQLTLKIFYPTLFHCTKYNTILSPKITFFLSPIDHSIELFL